MSQTASSEVGPVEWVEPPTPRTAFGRTPSVVTPQLLDHLKGRPGEWARVRQASASKAATQWVKNHRDEGYEVTVRSVGQDEQGRTIYDEYMRWVGSTA